MPFNKIIKISIYLLVFLLPLFWLPFSYEVFEFNKQYLLFFLISLAFFAWLARMVLVDKEIRFKKTPLDIFVAAFIFLAILSAIFSVDKDSSLFGFYGRFSGGLISLLSLAILYFLITNNISSYRLKGPAAGIVKGQKSSGKTQNPIPNDQTGSQLQQPMTITGLLRTFLWSSFFVILFTYFSIFGAWTKINSQLSIISNQLSINLPSLMFQPTFNPTAGSMEGLAIFLAVITVFLVSKILLEAKGKLSIIINYLLLIATLILLILIDFTAAWIVLLVTLALFLALALWKRMFKERVGKLMMPILVMIIAGLFMFVNTAKLTQNLDPKLKLNLPKEEVLSQGQSWGIGWRATTSSVKNGFIGTGIGTFFHDFSKFKSPEFNQTKLWQIRFDRPGNHLSEILATMGFLGIISYLALIGTFLLIFYFFVSSYRLEGPAAGIVKGQKSSGKTQNPMPNDQTGSRSQHLMTVPLSMAFLALLVAQFVYYQNTILAFTFWLILALSVANWQGGRWVGWSFQKFPELSLIANAFLIIIGLVILGTYYFGQQFYRADVIYAKSQKMALGPERTALIEKAVKMNPHFAKYQSILARAYLDEALKEMRRPVEEQDPILLQRAVAKTIDTAKVATKKGPGQVFTWETLAMVYRDIRLVASGAKEWAIKSFEKAIELEPTNPVLHTELGKLLAIDNPQKARESFNKALELKPDYLDAQIQSALLYEREGNLEEAIRQMEDLSLEYLFNTEVLFQLGRLYFNADRIDDAISQLERVVDIMPNHSNALYSLGIAYKEKGEKEKAIKSFEKVLELNPGNQDVIQKLEQLRK